MSEFICLREVRHTTRREVAEQLICTAHLLDVWPHFCHVGQDIQCNDAPFLEGQRLCLHNPTRCEAPFKEFELGFMSLGVASIVPRLWIMQTVISGSIVCCHEVCRFLATNASAIDASILRLFLHFARSVFCILSVA